MSDNFWSTSDDEDLTNSDGSFDAGGGSMEPIPDGTSVMAMPTEAKWDDYEGTEFISIQWQVAKPDHYANRRLWQKLYVTDVDARAKNPDQKRDKAKRMLAAIDKNAGGKLAKKGARPTDVDLMSALVGKAMVLKLGVWELDGGKSGNWVQSVSPKASGVPSEAPKVKPKAAPAPAAFDDDSDIPF